MTTTNEIPAGALYGEPRETFHRPMPVPDGVRRIEIERHGGRWYARALTAIHMFEDEVQDWPAGDDPESAMRASLTAKVER